MKLNDKIKIKKTDLVKYAKEPMKCKIKQIRNELTRKTTT